MYVKREIGDLNKIEIVEHYGEGTPGRSIPQSDFQ